MGQRKLLRLARSCSWRPPPRQRDDGRPARVYTSSPTQTITGTVEVGHGDSLTSLTVNGAAATVDGETWSAEVPLTTPPSSHRSSSRRYARGDVIRERRTVVYGDGASAAVLPPAAELDDAVGLRINDRAFDKIGPVVKTLTTIDTGAIARRHRVPRRVHHADHRTLHARASTSAPPTIADFGVALDSNQDNVTRGGHAHRPPRAGRRRCPGPRHPDELRPRDRRRLGDDRRELRPPAQPDRPDLLDVNLVGASPVVTLGNVNDDFVGGICSIPVIEQIVGLFLPDVRTLMQEN